MKWFRWHRGTTEDSKFAIVAKMASSPGMAGYDDSNGASRVTGSVTVTDVIATWCVILEDCASEKHWGVCEKQADEIAIILRWGPVEVSNILAAMAQKGMIEPTDAGYKVSNWDKYQYVSDSDPTGAERQKRYRERKKNNNAEETDESHERNALLTRPDTEADTDTEKKKKNIPVEKPEEVSAQIWSDFHVLRQKKKSPITATVMNGIRKEAAKAGYTLEQALAECCTRGWQSFKAEWITKPAIKGRTPMPSPAGG